MLYDQEANTHDLQLGDTLSAPADSGGGGVYTFDKLADLLMWHQTYPVAAWETARNDAAGGSLRTSTRTTLF